MRSCRACKVQPEDECSSGCLLKPAFLMSIRERADMGILTGACVKMTPDEAHWLLDLIDVLEASDAH